MLRRRLVAAALAGVGSIGLLGGQAGAVATGQMTGTCLPQPVGVVGVGSTGGVQYEIVGIGVSADPTTRATQVECKVVDLDANVTLNDLSSGFVPGPAAALAASPVIHTLDNFVVCVRVERIDLDGTLESTPWTAPDGSPCS